MLRVSHLRISFEFHPYGESRVCRPYSSKLLYIGICNSHSWAQLAKKVTSVDHFCNYIVFKSKPKERDTDNEDAHGFSMYTTQCPVMLTHCEELGLGLKHICMGTHCEESGLGLKHISMGTHCEESGLGLKHVCMKTRVPMNTISRVFWLGRV